MDVALADRCSNRTGHLFIALNNQTEQDRHLRVEVIVPGGMPENQEHRFELISCPGPESAVKITDPLVEDVRLDAKISRKRDYFVDWRCME